MWQKTVDETSQNRGASSARRPTGSDNVAIFASLTQTASAIDMFRALFRSSPAVAQNIIFAARGDPVPPS